ncbi:hypothetical protein GCM10028807_39260 [Spirosoma daeguense]
MRFIDPNSALAPISLSKKDNTPAVTVICICFNQGEYVIQALQSVIDQSLPTIELIVIDNGSRDSSVGRITDFVANHPEIQFFQNHTNQGLNRAFNQGLALARGRYVVDLSADDILLPERLARQVAFFDTLPDSYGVVFTNAAYIDARGQHISYHYPVNINDRVQIHVPSGGVFEHILRSYFICTPTMLIRRDVLTKLGGYDEMLAYEDFDFWVRSSRTYHYAYLDDVLTQKRLIPTSMSMQVSQKENTILRSTLEVCRKAHLLCHTPEEYKALAHRLRQLIRKAFYVEQFDLAQESGALLSQLERPDLLSRMVLFFCRLHTPINPLYRFYLKNRLSRFANFLKPKRVNKCRNNG